VYVQDDETGNILLLANTESVISASVLNQLLPAASADDLVSQLNIEKRPAVGDSLLATTNILQVRPDVNGSLESYITEDSESAAACLLEHLQAGVQQMACTNANIEVQATAQVSEKNDESVEIDLNDIVTNSYYDCTALLQVLDAGMVEQQLKDVIGGQSQENSERSLMQPTPVEDLIDGPPQFTPVDFIDGPPSSNTFPYTTVPDTLSYQLPGAMCGLPRTVDSCSERFVSAFQFTAAATNPRNATTAQKSLPFESGFVHSSLSVEQSGGHEVRYWSLPNNVSASSLSASQIHLLTSTSQQVDTAQKTVTATLHQKSTSDHLPVVNAGLGLPVLVANARLMPSAVPAPFRIVSVNSPVGQITGTMIDLSIDNKHPLLRSMLTEPTQNAASDQRKNAADQVVVFLLVFFLLLSI